MFSVVALSGTGSQVLSSRLSALSLSFVGQLPVSWNTSGILKSELMQVDNIVVNNLFGMATGLGLMPITFDWSQIAYNGSPLVVPFWAQANVFAGWLIVFALISPILYYTNTW
jgi:hypothetical protein